MMDMKAVKTAVVGCGKISSVYLRNLTELFSITEVVALCDINEQRAKEQAEKYNVPAVMKIDEIVNSDEIELVVVLTGPMYNFDVIKRMLMAGKHVYTEKTIAENTEKGRELLKLADDNGVYLGAAPDTILGAGIQTARKALDARLIGTPTSALVSINRNHSLNAEEFKYLQKSASACFMYDVGIYYVAALLALLGPVGSVCGFTGEAREHEIEHLFNGLSQESIRLPGTNLAAASVRLENGCLASLLFDGVSNNEEWGVMSIFGTEGILHVGGCGDFDGEVRLVRTESGECVLPHTHGYNGRKSLPYVDPLEEEGYGHRGLGVAEMAWAIRRARPCRCSKEFAFHTLELLEGIEKSSRDGRVYEMTSRFSIEPLKSGYLSTMFHGMMRGDAERSLIN